MNKQYHFSQRSRGFTLIELMIVVVIIGIIAAIAYPSYIENVRETRRTTAKSALLELASYMERFYTENFTYVGTTVPGAISNDLEQYTLAIDASTATSYTISATPQGPQTADRCGTLTLDQRGVEGADEANCW